MKQNLVVIICIICKINSSIVNIISLGNIRHPKLICIMRGGRKYGTVVPSLVATMVGSIPPFKRLMSNGKRIIAFLYAPIKCWQKFIHQMAGSFAYIQSPFSTRSLLSPSPVVLERVTDTMCACMLLLHLLRLTLPSLRLTPLSTFFSYQGLRRKSRRRMGCKNSRRCKGAVMRNSAESKRLEHLLL